MEAGGEILSETEVMRTHVRPKRQNDTGQNDSSSHLSSSLHLSASRKDRREGRNACKDELYNPSANSI